MNLPRSFVDAVVFACITAGLSGRAFAGPAPVDSNDSTPARRQPSGAPRVVEAIAVQGTIVVDGKLDDEVWKQATPASHFLQSEPHDGQPATEETEVRVSYDGANLYVGAYLHDHEPDRIIVNDIRKDFQEQDQDDFEVLLDTFRDHQNGYVFITNALGAKADRQVAKEGREVNPSWDAVWTVKTQRVADGWTLEMAIPFRSLRFPSGSEQRWGINFSRRIRRKNEIVFWSPVPRSYNLARVSLAGELSGLVLQGTSRDLRVKPYLAGTTLRETGGASFDQHADIGLDVKYGITPGLTLDATLHPDFAQVEADEQQVNLTQFSQFFPEKREFFLENSGVFYVGDAARNNQLFAAPTADEDLLLFFSRRIGLSDSGKAISIPAGVRLTGNVEGFTVGALSMQTKATEISRANNYSVLRVRRNIGTGSDLGVIFMNRQATDTSGDYNRVFGVDGNIRFARKVDWNSYLIGSATPGVNGGQYAVRSSLNYEGNFLHSKVGILQIGENFRDDLGYYLRTGARKYLIDIGIRPRFAWLQHLGIREMHPHVVDNYYQDLTGRMIAKTFHNGYTFFLNDGGYVEFSVNPKFQRTTEPFTIHTERSSADSVVIPPGSYDWAEYQVIGGTDPSRPVALGFTGITGGLWSGRQKTIRGSLTVHPGYRVRLTASVSRTSASLDIPRTRFVETLYTARLGYSFATNMFVDALTQYEPSAKTFNANVRFNLIHHPLSDLFVVFNEQHITGPDAPLPGRSVIVKFTQMAAF